jgi:hypothetical protein
VRAADCERDDADVLRFWCDLIAHHNRSSACDRQVFASISAAKSGTAA